jgi:hypothetical protein
LMPQPESITAMANPIRRRRVQALIIRLRAAVIVEIPSRLACCDVTIEDRFRNAKLPASIYDGDTDIPRQI